MYQIIMSFVVRRSGNRLAPPEGKRGPGRSPPWDGAGEGGGRYPPAGGYPRVCIWDNGDAPIVGRRLPAGPGGPSPPAPGGGR